MWILSIIFNHSLGFEFLPNNILGGATLEKTVCTFFKFSEKLRGQDFKNEFRRIEEDLYLNVCTKIHVTHITNNPLKPELQKS